MLSTLIKQAIKDLLDNVVFPKIQSLESQIGDATVKTIIEQITTEAQAAIDTLLS